MDCSAELCNQISELYFPCCDKSYCKQHMVNDYICHICKYFTCCENCIDMYGSYRNHCKIFTCVYCEDEPCNC